MNVESRFNLLYHDAVANKLSIVRNQDIVETSLTVIKNVYRKQLPKDLVSSKELIAVSPVHLNRGNTWKLKDLEGIGRVLLITDKDEIIPYPDLQQCIKEITKHNIFNFYIHFFDKDFIPIKDFFLEEHNEFLKDNYNKILGNPPDVSEGVFSETALKSGKIDIDQDKLKVKFILAGEKEVASTTDSLIEEPTQNEVGEVVKEKEYFDIFKALDLQQNQVVTTFPQMEVIFEYSKSDDDAKLRHFKSLLRDIVYQQILDSGLNFLLSENEHYDYELRVNYYTYEDVNEMIDVIFNRYEGLTKVELKSDANQNLVVSSCYNDYVTNERLILTIEGMYRLILGDDTYQFTHSEKLEAIKNELAEFTGKAKYVKSDN